MILMADLINRDAFIVGLKERRAKAYLSELYDCDTEAEKQRIDDEMYYSTQSFIDVLMREPAVDAVPVSYIRKWIESHPTDYTTVESMLTDWREEGDSDEVERC